MPFIVASQALVLIGFSITFAYAGKIDKTIPQCYFAICLACIGLYPIIPGANAWNSNNLAGPARRSIGIGLLGTFASSGGLGGSFVYQAKEAPWYPTRFGVSLGMAALGMVAALTSEFALWTINKKNSLLSPEEIYARYSKEELAAMGDKSPLFKYKL